MKKPNVINIPIRVTISPASRSEATLGSKYHSVATIELPSYGKFGAASSGVSKISARKYAQAFALENVAKAILASAEKREQAATTVAEIKRNGRERESILRELEQDTGESGE